MAPEYGNFIGGEWTESESKETFVVANPAASSEAVAKFQDSTSDDARAAIEAAVEAQTEWANTPGPERGSILKRAG
jgi:aldehyde dehydrogenase (NAD+)